MSARRHIERLVHEHLRGVAEELDRRVRRLRMTALGALIQSIEQSIEAGADAMVGPCPLYHLSLDGWQSKLEKQTGGLPIPELAQLRRRRSRLEESELKFKPHVVSMAPVLEKVEVR